jgi:hypothetical protein
MGSRFEYCLRRTAHRLVNAIRFPGSIYEMLQYLRPVMLRSKEHPRNCRNMLDLSLARSLCISLAADIILGSSLGRPWQRCSNHLAQARSRFIALSDRRINSRWICQHLVIQARMVPCNQPSTSPILNTGDVSTPSPFSNIPHTSTLINPVQIESDGANEKSENDGPT